MILSIEMREYLIMKTNNRLDENKKFTIPPSCQSIKIDVGLAGEAPNAAIWLSEDKDRFVIGIEPLEYHWKMIENFETSNSLRPYPYGFKILQLEEGVVKLNKQNVCNIDDKFCKIQCAVDCVDKPTKKKFYQMDRTGGASGSSSLLKPTSEHPHFVENEIDVDVLSMEMILDHIDWDRFPFIEQIKTDCEGHDFSVVKSIGEKYLSRILYITSEMSTNGSHWENSYNHQEFIDYMENRGFAVMERTSSDVFFVNNSLVKVSQIMSLGMNCKVLGA